MYVHIAIYRIHPEFVDSFVERIATHAATTLRDEPNCVQFDVSRSREDSTQFVLYEVFRHVSDLDEHRKTPHVAAWLRDSAGWLADRIVYPLDRLFPAETE